MKRQQNFSINSSLILTGVRNKADKESLFFFKVIYSILKHREKINEKTKVLKTKDLFGQSNKGHVIEI